MAKNYQPVSCVAHERLEFAALRRQPLWITYTDAGGAQCRERLWPRDIYTRGGAEWLDAQGPTGRLTLRLDSIKAIADSGGDD